MKKQSQVSVRWAASAFAGALVCSGVAVATPASAVPAVTAVSVTSLADTETPGTLRSAFIAAEATPGADEITFAVTGTITLESPLPTVTRGGVSIVGPGSSELTIMGATVPEVEQQSFEGYSMTFTSVEFGNSFSISGLTISGGSGAIVAFLNGDDSVAPAFTLSDVVVENTVPLAGAVAVAGNMAGTASIVNSVFSNNKGGEFGGAVYAGGLRELSIDSSTIDGNSAVSAGAGVIAPYVTDVRIVNSTISNNTTDGIGGGYFGIAGLSVELMQSTFSGNVAGAFGSALLVSDTETATILHSTVTGNGSADADSPAVILDVPEFSIDSSILSGNRSSAAVPTDFAFGDEWIPTGALDAMVTEVQA
ncbi:right-handed parallel beta-helix repeat-containing protein, partial [Glaciibacter psychrotolerans]